MLKFATFFSKVCTLQNYILRRESHLEKREEKNMSFRREQSFSPGKKVGESQLPAQGNNHFPPLFLSRRRKRRRSFWPETWTAGLTAEKEKEEEKGNIFMDCGPYCIPSEEEEDGEGKTFQALCKRMTCGGEKKVKLS